MGRSDAFLGDVFIFSVVIVGRNQRRRDQRNSGKGRSRWGGGGSHSGRGLQL
jgi:hypothetical protein